MDTKETKRDEEPLADFEKLRLFVVYPVLALLGLGVCSLWLPPAFHGWQIKRDINSDISPLVKQAKALDLTYEQARTDPSGAAGKPVVWCVQNRGATEVTVEGNENKHLAVSNYPGMPVFMGGKHQACTPMLLLLEKTEPGRPVAVFFREAL